MAWRMIVDTDANTFLKNLQQLDADIAKGLDKQMKDAARQVRKVASRKVAEMSPPLSGWAISPWFEQDRGASSSRSLRWNTTKARGGLAVGGARRKKSGVFISYGVNVEQRNAQGAILELAGGSSDGYRGARNSGGSLLMRQNLRRKLGDGPYPRTLYPAYYEGMGDAREMIERVVAEAERRVNGG
jgi:hypothetical protein